MPGPTYHFTEVLCEDIRGLPGVINAHTLRVLPDSLRMNPPNVNTARALNVPQLGVVPGLRDNAATPVARTKRMTHSLTYGSGAKGRRQG